MTLKLNLGAGHVLFPLSRDEPLPYHAHLEPLPDTCFEPGWVNVDHANLPGIGEQVNLFRLPWIRSSNGSPWNDSSVDEIYAGHIVEHIPHSVRPSDGMPLAWVKNAHTACERYDGFFVWFAEVWRVLRPGGLIYIRCPYGASPAALADPTHTRYIVPGSFSYLGKHGQPAPFDCEIPFEFEQAEPLLLRFTHKYAERLTEMSDEERTEAPFKFMDSVDELRIVLRAVKPNPNGSG